MLSRKQIWRRVNTNNKKYENKSDKSEKKDKKVYFYNIVDVKLIPSFRDFGDIGYKHAIWWDDIDYMIFKREYMKEIENNKKYNSL